MKKLIWILSGLGLWLVATSSGFSDSKDGPRRWTKTLKKTSEVVYKIVFVADKAQTRQFAEFACIGDGSTDVDIEVYDSMGKMIAKDDRYSDLALARWIPSATQEYTIKVRNLGSEDNMCLLGHN